MILLRIVLASLLLLLPAQGQEEGWHYSPLPGEGDRATLGCALRSTAEEFNCIAVRCEDDFSIGIYAHTSRTEPHAGEWLITIDRVNRPFLAEKGEAPYGARLPDPEGWLLHNLQNGAVAYLHPLEGPPAPLNFIPLSGSLYEINRALAYCLPPKPAEPNEPPGVTPANP
ncbi:hypothetical protein [Devosia sp. 1566]|uniref:hypothetical protein n=1 Tax=Devosia sp. 1566 TaxID=2499144 RepID=UPI000FDA9657|nr:hypothetical protein [Devosia sp. 1566]